MLLTYNELLELVQLGVIRGCDASHVNPSSIDVHLGTRVLKESSSPCLVDVDERVSPNFVQEDMPQGGHVDLAPGDFVLASTRQLFYLPSDISALFVMKSRVARCGLDQMNAAWCSPGWTGSALTLELKNNLTRHSIRLREGMAIGQMVFFRGDAVPEEMLYTVRGSFNYQPSTHKSS